MSIRRPIFLFTILNLSSILCLFIRQELSCPIYSLVYAPTGKNITVDVTKLGFKDFNCQWFNPRNGELTKAEYSNEKDCITFDPPGEIERGNDWVVILTSN